MEFLQQAFIYLGAAVVAVPFANRLGLGAVLGYLIAGITIGPVLGIVGGAESEAVKHFAEFGVVMMLFLVGLELQPSMLWRMRGQLLGLGGLQLLLTTALVTGGALGFGLDWQVALAVGIVLSLSSTAIVLQTFNEKGWMKTPAGQSGFSVLLCQDMAVIPMLALLPLLATPELAHQIASGGDGHHGSVLSDFPGWAQGLIILAVIAAIILVGRFLSRPIFRFIAAARLPEVFTATALFLVIGIALAMHMIGLSPALGTFLAGVVLSESEYRHELESDIEPFKGLLLGLFFISVGAGVDFGMLFGNPLLIVGLALAIMLVKFLVLAILGKIFKMSGGDFWLFALSLAQAGEFAFVLFSFTDSHGIIPTELGKQLTLVVSLSMLFTPLLFILFEKVISPRMVEDTSREADKVEEKGTVVIAGIGRFGQIISRLLMTNGYKAVILDHDAGMIETVRKINTAAYYGDATRPDLLHAAGIHDAKLFVAALDDRERQNHVVEHVAKNHPHCRIVARALNRHHVYELEEAGAHQVVRELFEGSLDAARHALIELGEHPFKAERQVRAFRNHDIETLQLLKKPWMEAGMDHGYFSITRTRLEELSGLMKEDRRDRHDTTARGWNPPPGGTVE